MQRAVRMAGLFLPGACTALATTVSMAQAQSSVTLYGILDSGVEYVTHTNNTGSGNVVCVNTGNRVNSRWGFTGREDLGDGLRAIFTLESGIAMNTGGLQQGARLFGRMAYVGMESRWGTLMAGRQQTPMYQYFLPIDPLNYSSYGIPAQDAQFIGRADNAVEYLGGYGPLKPTGFTALVMTRP